MSTSGFSIDYDKGIIKLHKRLNPRVSPIALQIRAKDIGQPPRSSTASCSIHIIDINDHVIIFILISKNP